MVTKHCLYRVNWEGTHQTNCLQLRFMNGGNVSHPVIWSCLQFGRGYRYLVRLINLFARDGLNYLDVIHI